MLFHMLSFVKELPHSVFIWVCIFNLLDPLIRYALSMHLVDILCSDLRPGRVSCQMCSEFDEKCRRTALLIPIDPVDVVPLHLRTCFRDIRFTEDIFACFFNKNTFVFASRCDKGGHLRVGGEAEANFGLKKAKTRGGYKSVEATSLAVVPRQGAYYLATINQACEKQYNNQFSTL